MIDILTLEKAGDVVNCDHPISAKNMPMELVSLHKTDDKEYDLEDGKYCKETWLVRPKHRGTNGKMLMKTFYRQTEIKNSRGLN